MVDMLIGDELIRIQFEVFDVNFVFTNLVLQLGVEFAIVSPSGQREMFAPEKKQGGCISAVWHLVGQKVRKASCKGDFVVVFEDGSAVEILATPGRIRGSIIGRSINEGNVLFQDF